MTMTSHEARKSMTVTGPIWTCHKCEEPWPCETEQLGQRVERLELAIERIGWNVEDALAEGNRTRIPVIESDGGDR